MCVCSRFFSSRCIICICEYELGQELRSLPCLHTYHRACIDDWLIRAFHCPVCLQEIQPPAAASPPRTSPDDTLESTGAAVDSATGTGPVPDPPTPIVRINRLVESRNRGDAGATSSGARVAAVRTTASTDSQPFDVSGNTSNADSKGDCKDGGQDASATTVRQRRRIHSIAAVDVVSSQRREESHRHHRMLYRGNSANRIDWDRSLLPYNPEDAEPLLQIRSHTVGAYYNTLSSVLFRLCISVCAHVCV